MSILSIEGESQQLSQSQTQAQQHLFDKSIKNINDSFGNISSYLIKTEAFDNMTTYEESNEEEKLQQQNKLSIHLQELQSREQLSSQHCISKICKEKEDIFRKTSDMVGEYLLNNVSSLHEIMPNDFDHLKQAIKSFIQTEKSQDVTVDSISIEQLIFCLLQIYYTK